MSSVNVGKWINAYRRERGISQSELARRLNCTKQTVSNYERGIREPDYNTLATIAEILGIPLSMFITGTDVQHNENAPVVNISDVKPSNKYSWEAMVLASDYDALDDYGRKAVRAVADVEMERMVQEVAQQSSA